MTKANDEQTKKHSPHPEHPHDSGSSNPHPTNGGLDWNILDTKYIFAIIACLINQCAAMGIKTIAELDAALDQRNKANGTNEIRPIVSGAWNMQNCDLAKAKYLLPLFEKFLALYFDDFSVSEMSHEAQDFVAQHFGFIVVHGDEHSQNDFGQANGYFVFNTKRLNAKLYATWWQTAFKAVRGQPDKPDYDQGILGAKNMRADEVIERTDLLTNAVLYLVICHDHSMLDPNWAPGREDDPTETTPIRWAANHERAKLIKELRDQGKDVMHDGDKNTQLGEALGYKDTAPLMEIADLHLAGNPKGENRSTQVKGKRIDGTFIDDNTLVLEYDALVGGTNPTDSYRTSTEYETTLKKARGLKHDLDQIDPLLVDDPATLAAAKLAMTATIEALVKLDLLKSPQIKSHDEPQIKIEDIFDHVLRRMVFGKKKRVA